MQLIRRRRAIARPTGAPNGASRDDPAGAPRSGGSRCTSKLTASLAAATCALLNAAPLPSVAAEGEKRNWRFDTALLFYDEGERVNDISASVLARRSFRAGRMLSLTLAVDTLTGASASGAAPARDAQTFTTPSGNSTYRIQAGQTPLDPTFLDTRVALSGAWKQPLGQKTSADFGLSLSNEYDYFHAGVNARFSRDFNRRNTTLQAGFAFASDSLDPVGGAPIPLAEMLPEGETGNKRGTDSKTVTDFMVGVTQVLGRKTIGQLNYSVSRSSGYLTDPYKLLSVVDSATGDPVAGTGGLFLYRFESRPDSRTKHSLFGRVKHQLRRNILDTSYRFMTDDWGVDSHTLDVRFRWRFERFYLQPHLRYYTQSSADFYRAVLLDGKSLPAHASADYRLGELDGTTLGLKLGVPFDESKEWSLRVEYYEQSGRSPPGSSIGSLGGFDLYPSVDALIVQAGYRF